LRLCLLEGILVSVDPSQTFLLVILEYVDYEPGTNGSKSGAVPPAAANEQFLQMLPLTSEIAGLPQSTQGSYFSEGQMENRAIAIKAAFKIAKQLMKDVAG